MFRRVRPILGHVDRSQLLRQDNVQPLVRLDLKSDGVLFPARVPQEAQGFRHVGHYVDVAVHPGEAQRVRQTAGVAPACRRGAPQSGSAGSDPAVRPVRDCPANPVPPCPPPAEERHPPSQAERNSASSRAVSDLGNATRFTARASFAGKPSDEMARGASGGTGPKRSRSRRQSVPNRKATLAT